MRILGINFISTISLIITISIDLTKMEGQILQQLLLKEKRKTKKIKSRKGIKRHIALAEHPSPSKEHILPCKLRGDQIGLTCQCFDGGRTCTQSR